MTHVADNNQSGRDGLHEWGSLLNVSVEETWTYRAIFTFNANGGTGTMSNQTIDNSGNLTENAFTRTGYTFKNWTANQDGTGKTYGNKGAVTVNADYKGPKTLYAQWDLANYSISYDLNGGAVATANPASYTIETATFTLNNPTRAGYTFVGWTGSNGETPQTTVQITKGSTENKTYTANWAPITYTITYDLAGGQGSNPATYTVETPTFQLADGDCCYLHLVTDAYSHKVVG